MARSTVFLGILLLGMFFVVSPVMADDICVENFNSLCIGCHNTDRVCEKLGSSENEWAGILKWMVDMGAEIESDDITAMSQCFSAPSPGVKAACRQ